MTEGRNGEQTRKATSGVWPTDMAVVRPVTLVGALEEEEVLAGGI